MNGKLSRGTIALLLILANGPAFSADPPKRNKDVRTAMDTSTSRSTMDYLDLLAVSGGVIDAGVLVKLGASLGDRRAVKSLRRYAQALDNQLSAQRAELGKLIQGQRSVDSVLAESRWTDAIRATEKEIATNNANLARRLQALPNARLMKGFAIVGTSLIIIDGVGHVLKYYAADDRFKPVQPGDPLYERVQQSLSSDAVNLLHREQGRSGQNPAANQESH